MNLKRKIAVFALAGVMAVGMSIPAMAAGEEFNATVKGSYSGEAGADTVIAYSYSKISEFNFTYSAGDKGTWNPETHEYENGSGTGKWTSDGNNTVTITNHSNTAIDVKPVYTAEAGYEDIQLGTNLGGTQGVLTIETAEGTSVDEAPKGSFTVGMTADSGALEEGEVGVTLGHLTLSVTAAE